MENKERIRISIDAFGALENPSYCEDFIEGHTNVLRDIGISVNKLTSANIAWSKSPYSFVITARLLLDNQVVGGARVDIGGKGYVLPIEHAIGYLDGNIYSIIKEKATIGGIGEICGVWTSRKMSGTGIALLLIRTAVSIATQLGLSSLFVLCSEATFSMFTKMGCTVCTSLGKNGTFYYPKEDLIATALILQDTKALDGATELNREKIFNLRDFPLQTIIEPGPKGELEVNYDLVIKTANIS